MLLTDPSPPPRAASLGRDVILAMLPPDGENNGPLARAARRPPYGTVALTGPDGPLRLAAFRRAPDTPARPAHRETALPSMASLHESGPSFRMFGADAGTVEEDAPDPDLEPADPMAMAALLDPQSRRRFLDFLLSFCRAAFRLGQDADFAATCAHVARLCGAVEAAATPVAAIMPGWQLLRGVAGAASDTLYVVGARGVRLNGADLTGEDFVAVEGAAAGDLLLAIGEDVRLWNVAAVEGKLPNVLALPSDANGFAAAAHAACGRAFARAAAGTPGAALVRELRLLHPAQAQKHDDPALPIGGALELALPDGAGGIFLRGWLRDPLDLVAEATLVTPAGEQPVAAAALHRILRPDLNAMLAKANHRDSNPRPGFVAHLPDPSGGLCLQPTLRLTLRSGATVDLVPPLRPLPAATARDAVLSSILPQEAVGTLLADCLVPATTALHRAARAERGTEHVRRFGTPHPRPAVSILVPLYRQLGFLRFQLGAFAADPACRAADIVLALDSPEQESEVEHLLRGLHHLHDLPMTLVVMERNGGFSAATNAAARHARGKVFLLLNSDVVPQRPGWLAALTAARSRARAAAATAKLLFDDGSLQHAGMYYERDTDGMWFNRHYHKGMPRNWPGADRPRRVPGGTGAALLVERRAFEAVGGLCEDYVVGDYEDSDLCLRLQEAGGAIWYAPEAEMYHFERRSIALHAGYQRTLACQFNRHLHHGRWDGAMTALMAERRYQPGAAT
jgi:GT2 family glycosyltransferase